MYPRQRDYLNTVWARLPQLRQYYLIKEWLRQLYGCPDRKAAEALMSRILVCCQSSDDAEIVRWGRTLSRWRGCILDHFLSRGTNAYTEGAHTKIKLMKRASYGFRNVSVYIKKMLLAFLPPVLFTLYCGGPHFSS